MYRLSQYLSFSIILHNVWHKYEYWTCLDPPYEYKQAESSYSTNTHLPCTHSSRQIIDIILASSSALCDLLFYMIEIFSLHDSEIHLISCRHNSQGMTMVTSTINRSQQSQNYNTSKLEVFQILLLISNSEVFFIVIQLWSLIGRGVMSLLWTLKLFICVQEWGHGRTLPKSSSLYQLYTNRNAKGRNET